MTRLAEVACLSPYHFHRVFQGMLGKTISEYVRQARLQQAACRLIDSEMPIARIALEAGYESHESFTRAFKAMAGMAPSAYRNNPVSIFALPSNPLRNTGGDIMDVRIENITDQAIAYVSYTGAYYLIGSAFDTLGKWAQSQPGVLGPQSELIGIFLDDPESMPEEKLRSRACVTLSQSVETEAPVETGVLKGGEFAVVTYVGSYSGLGDAWMRAFTEALPKTGRKPAPMGDENAASCFEKYLNDMSTTPEEELITEIWIPLVKSE